MRGPSSLQDIPWEDCLRTFPIDSFVKVSPSRTNINFSSLNVELVQRPFSHCNPPTATSMHATGLFWACAETPTNVISNVNRIFFMVVNLLERYPSQIATSILLIHYPACFFVAEVLTFRHAFKFKFCSTCFCITSIKSFFIA